MQNMKDITHYFKNSPKEDGIKDAKIENIRNGEEDFEEVEQKTIENGECSFSKENEENSASPKKKVKHHKKHRCKKNKKRKLSDPAVKGITELLSTTLSIESESSVSQTKEDSSQTEEQVTTELPRLQDSKVDENAAEPIVETTPNRVNAFHFMMNSRNNVIGTNSSGKEIHRKLSKTPDNEKEKTTNRKKKLEAWSEAKSSQKRKLTDNEIDSIIDYKLEKRAKRFKNLLSNKKDAGGKKSLEKIKKANDIYKKELSSSEESSTDYFKSEKNQAVIENKEVVKVKFSFGKKARRKLSLKKSPDGACNKSNDLSTENKVKDKNEENDEGKRNTPKPKKNKSKAKNDIAKSEAKAKPWKMRIQVQDDNSFSEQTNVKNTEEEMDKPSLEIQEKDILKEDYLNQFKDENIDVDEDNKIETTENLSENIASTSNEKEELFNEVDTKVPDEFKQNIVEVQSTAKATKSKQEEDGPKTDLRKRSQRILQLTDSHEGDIITDEDKQTKTIPKQSLKNRIAKKSTEEILSEDTADQNENLKNPIEPKVLQNQKQSNEEPELQPEDNRRVLRKRLPKKLESTDSSDSDNVTTKKKRNPRSKTKRIEDSDVELLSSSDDETRKTKSKKKSLKIAPVFIKKAPKPKIDPAVLEARRQFLMSGIPDTLKKEIEKQEINEVEVEIFPKISHVFQKSEHEEKYWNLPKVILNLSQHETQINKTPEWESLTKTVLNTRNDKEIILEKIKNVKSIIKNLKLENPNYPIYKSFRLLSQKSGAKKSHKTEVEKKPKKGKRKRSSVEIIKSIDDSLLNESLTLDPEFLDAAMWTEKYKPKSSDDIIGNLQSVYYLKKWLERWLDLSSEDSIKKKRKIRRNSGSDFDTTDCDSRDSTCLPATTIIISGPPGCGKSATIYALCNELNLNVLELNASSKRTGKKLMQELQEATQSHQVRKEHNFFNASKLKTHENKKICVLLVEDIDIVFEQDEGFINALSQLATNSKRPIILTTTNVESPHLQKFVFNFKVLPFTPLTAKTLGLWLQVLCLVEGYFVQMDSIGQLLEYNKGDVRKTLLQLQFWVLSGGQWQNQTKNYVDISQMEGNSRSSLLKDVSEETRAIEHKDCVRSFEIFYNEEPFHVPYYFSLGKFWWNTPNLLSFPLKAHIRLEKEHSSENNSLETKPNSTVRLKRSTPEEKQKLKTLSNLYDAVICTDLAYTKIDYWPDMEPLVSNTDLCVENSLELEQNWNSYEDNVDFVFDWTHCMVNGNLKMWGAPENGMNLALPDLVEKSWRQKRKQYKESFVSVVNTSSYLEQTSVGIDYLPILRKIIRDEQLRAANNTKRNNRFNNYLKNFNLNLNDSIVNTVCSTFNLSG